MSEKQAKRIDDLERKLIDLHDKYDEANDEKNTAILKAEKNKKDWFTPQMITTYMMVLGGIVAWGENYISRDVNQSQQEQKGKEDIKIGEGMMDYVNLRIGETDDNCELYLDAIIEAMPAYQRHKVEKFIELNGVDVSTNYDDKPNSENIVRSALFKTISKPTEIKVDLNPMMAPKPMINNDIKESPYQLIIKAAKLDEEINIKQIIKKSSKK